ncbi:MAG: hypothetical protein PHW95_02810 [Patescibacteria group bacterium]|nr:hypothetical protein [Patescibacteria group bacterium]
MIYLEGIMHRKIHLGLALIILAIVASIFALAISVQAYSPYYLGGRITSYIPGCTMATPVPDVCTGVACPCGSCGCVSAPCTPPAPAWSQTIITPYGSHRESVLCAPVGFPFMTGIPSPGRLLLGNGTSMYSPFKVGLGFGR